MKRLAALLLCLLFLLTGFARAAELVVHHGSRDAKRAAITMDDCYEPLNVRRTLDLCRQHNVPVTFFVLGAVLREEDRPLWQEALDLGCEIGNHTWGHLNLGKLRPEAIRRQLRLTQEKLDQVLGSPYPMRIMRPPYGGLSKDGTSTVVDAIAQEGYERIVLWDVSQTDFSLARGQVQNGSILLYHANPKDVHCLEQLIPHLLEQGFELVTVSQLLNLQAE